MSLNKLHDVKTWLREANINILTSVYLAAGSAIPLLRTRIIFKHEDHLSVMVSYIGFKILRVFFNAVLLNQTHAKQTSTNFNKNIEYK